MKKTGILLLVFVIVFILTSVPFADVAKAEEGVLGYVTVKFMDNGVRRQDEIDSGRIGPKYVQPLGQIIPTTQMAIQEGDTMADITLRLLDQKGIGYDHDGTTKANFYLKALKNFSQGGYDYDYFGEFDAGEGSGWMVTLNDWFINQGASAFILEDGDIIEWQYTCRYGLDIGCDMNTPSAVITDLEVLEGGALSSAYSRDVTEYTLELDDGAEAVRVRAYPENKWARTTYTANDQTYKVGRAIPVQDGTVIHIDCSFSTYYNDPEPQAQTEITITVRSQEPGTPGDVNGNGSVTSADARLVLLYTAGMATLTNTQKTLGDVNGSGSVTSADARRILLYVAGVIGSLTD